VYHRENAQEAFLVLAGACVLLVEGEERELKAWDFFYCPPQTEHVIVGAGDGPAVVLAVGSRGRGRKGLVYLVSEVAQKYGASVKKETTKPAEAYAAFPRSSRLAYREGWLPNR
jgi:oxalate decarboxylase/phosphoglucose isomerase-like protein (cupin superfamily)